MKSAFNFGNLNFSVDQTLTAFRESRPGVPERPMLIDLSNPDFDLGPASHFAENMMRIVDRLNAGTSFGPSMTSLDTLHRVEDNLFSRGRRPARTAKGKINWAEDLQSLRQMVHETALEDVQVPDRNLENLLAILESVIASSERDRRHEPGLAPSQEERALKVELRMHGDGLWERVYSSLEFTIPPSAMRFVQLHQSILHSVDRLALEGLTKGSILAVETWHGKNQLVDPEEISSLEDVAIAKSFCFASDLPEEWFVVPMTRPQRVAMARQLIEKVATLVHESGKRATKDDLVRLAVETIDALSCDAAEEAYRKADFPDKGKSGRRKQVEVISFSDLNALK